MSAGAPDPLPGPGTSSGQSIRILVVDDHPVVREGLVAVLEDEPDLAIVGAAGSAAEALRLAQRHVPDVVLLDLELPDAAGIETIPQLLAAVPGVRVVVFTAYDTDDLVLGAMEAGACGYVLKGAAAGEIARAVRAAHAGEAVLAPRLAARLASRLAAQLHGPRGDRLTARERQVLRLVAEGRANKQIAGELAIAERTVKFHIASASRKLGAENRAQAAAVAIRRGLL